MTAPGHSLQHWQIIILIAIRATLKNDAVLNHSGPMRNFPLPNTIHCVKRVHQRPYPRCASSISNRIRCSIPSELSLELLFLVTTKIVSSPGQTSLPLFYVRIPCSSSSVWSSNAIVPSSNVVVKMQSVKAFYPRMRSLLSSLQLGTKMLPKTSIGS